MRYKLWNHDSQKWIEKLWLFIFFSVEGLRGQSPDVHWGRKVVQVKLGRWKKGNAQSV